ncbi:MAG: hypothetical protein JOZ87_29685, partial [Chloroflexi bacterium]|nr:hypothetical protein [Chloroflexota bacterium]
MTPALYQFYLDVLELRIMAYAPLATGLLSGTYAADLPPPEDSLWGSRRRDRFAETLTGR